MLIWDLRKKPTPKSTQRRAAGAGQPKRAAKIWHRCVADKLSRRFRKCIIVQGMGYRPHSNRAAVYYLTGMNMLLLIVVLLLLFGGGGFYFGGPVIGGGGLGLILLICLIIFLMGGFRTTKS